MDQEGALAIARQFMEQKGIQGGELLRAEVESLPRSFGEGKAWVFEFENDLLKNPGVWIDSETIIILVDAESLEASVFTSM